MEVKWESFKPRDIIMHATGSILGAVYRKSFPWLYYRNQWGACGSVHYSLARKPMEVGISVLLDTEVDGRHICTLAVEGFFNTSAYGHDEKEAIRNAMEAYFTWLGVDVE